jgi:HAE1 family hydrophobic/amphiphilic exporter-1
MLVGTVLGVLLIPGLYYVFATLIVGRTLIRGERDEPISEQFIRTGEEAVESQEVKRMLRERLMDLLKRRKD